MHRPINEYCIVFKEEKHGLYEEQRNERGRQDEEKEREKKEESQRRISRREKQRKPLRWIPRHTTRHSINPSIDQASLKEQKQIENYIVFSLREIDTILPIDD